LCYISQFYFDISGRWVPHGRPVRGLRGPCAFELGLAVVFQKQDKQSGQQRQKREKQ
jgi:hypothetical protein